MQTINLQVLNEQEIALVVGGAGESGLVEGAIDTSFTGQNEGGIFGVTREHGRKPN